MLNVFERKEDQQLLESFLKKGYHFIFWGTYEQCAGYVCKKIDPSFPELRKSTIDYDWIFFPSKQLMPYVTALGEHGRGELFYTEEKEPIARKLVPYYDFLGLHYRSLSFEETLEELDIKIYQKKNHTRKEVL